MRAWTVSRAGMRLLGVLLYSVAVLPAGQVLLGQELGEGLANTLLLPPAVERRVDYVADVRPILSRHCYACHGPEKQSAGLRLDVKALALAGGDGGACIEVGDSSGSAMIRYVGGLVQGMEMPPPKPGRERVSDEELGVLRAWIDQGVEWPDGVDGASVEDSADWWSLSLLERPEVPEPGGGFAGWVRNPIDSFVGAKLAEKGLRPSPEAGRATLIRRLYFDLVGLPPSPKEVREFMADERADAYERLVDRLLARPEYGERWARHWLDVVHYGDTHGYDKDKPRPNAWPYRDYVIRAFNADKPYGRFVREQVAGDVLYPGTRDGVEALGFIAAGPWDFIGHAEVSEDKVDGQIARHLDRDDMVANTMGTFTSLTVHCAQCHNHKFDPITQEDYYSLQAVFAALDRADKRYDKDPEVGARRRALRERRSSLEVIRDELEGRVRELGGESLLLVEGELRKLQEAKEGEGQRPEFGYHSGIESIEGTMKWVEVDLGREVAIARIGLVGARDSFNNIGDGFGFPVRYRVEVRGEGDNPPRVVVDRSGQDQPNPGVVPQRHDLGGEVGRYVRVVATKLAPRQGDYIFALAELEVEEVGGENVARGAVVTALDSIEAPDRWGKGNLVDGIYPGVVMDRRGAIAALEASREAVLRERIPEELLRAQEGNRNALEEVEALLQDLPGESVVYAGTVHFGEGAFRGTGGRGGKPRTIHLLRRGDVRQQGVEVGPGAVLAVSQVSGRFELGEDSGEGDRRAALAEWLTDRNNPLTWRSVVNRLWQYHFGRGIVETPNDFGRMGQLPTHPELLDWLAVELRDGGESIKRIQRLMVMSATYRQVSVVPGEEEALRLAWGEAERLDAGNVYLWRMNRRRLEAEAIRDAVLWASGKLDTTMFGPGFEDFVVEKPEHSPHYQYHLYDPEDEATHRRSVYRFLVRSQLQPFMSTLDCADPSMQVGKRGESLSPLQALALLNNSLVLAMSRYMAERLEAGQGSIEEQVREGVWLALGRAPTEREAAVLAAYASRHGLANYCRLLFNLNEFSFVD